MSPIVKNRSAPSPLGGLFILLASDVLIGVFAPMTGSKSGGYAIKKL